MKEKKLTAKEVRFCEEYMFDFNKTQSAIRAGYSVKSARTIGYELLKKPHIASYVEGLKGKLSELSGVTALRNLLELKKIAYTSFSQLKDGEQL